MAKSYNLFDQFGTTKAQAFGWYDGLQKHKAQVKSLSQKERGAIRERVH